MTGRSLQKTLLCCLLLAASSTLMGAENLRYEIRGVEGRLLENVRNHVEALQLTLGARHSGSRSARLAENAKERARSALRPFGFYRPTISSQFRTGSGEADLLTLQIDPGPPIIISQLEVRLTGDGSNYAPLLAWQKSWALPVGAVLNQGLWEQHKQKALEIASAQGYLQAAFSEQSIELDLIENQASLTLVLDTGQRSLMGQITYTQAVLKPRVLDSIPRFSKGDPYSAFLLEEFRNDLWKTGFFTDVEVVERRTLEADGPVVDLQVNLKTDTRDVYQGSFGFGSDTGFRLQTGWSRRPVSSLGDRLDLAIGWRARENELLMRTNYRIPRRIAQRQYWVSELVLKTEHQEFEFKQTPEDQDAILLADGRINNIALRAGRLKVRNLKTSGQQAFETLFVQYLHERKDLALSADLPRDPVTLLPLLILDSDFQRQTTGNTNTLALGIDWDRPVVRGHGFFAAGLRDRAWMLASSKTWGSDIDFFQAYLSTRRNYLAGDRWKFLLRAEAGYTNAKVDKFSVNIGDRSVALAVTRLPEFYRFKAGGSMSVRGYGFENLSDNDLGSNNILTASAEVEFKFLESWSAAAFLDIGNAFNDWGKTELKKGIGVGIRWYTIAGAFRLDLARALDFEDQPWRVHFTIGTPLL